MECGLCVCGDAAGAIGVGGGGKVARVRAQALICLLIQCGKNDT